MEQYPPYRCRYIGAIMKIKPKRNKKRDPNKVLRQNTHLANDFIVYSIENTRSGVIWKKSLRDTKVHPQETYLLTKVRRTFNVVVGAVGRDGTGYTWSNEVVLTISNITGDDITPILKEYGLQQAKTLPPDQVLGTYFFATTDTQFDFSPHIVWDWLTHFDIFGKNRTYREYVIKTLTAQENFMLNTDLDKHQVGGSHYSKYAIQPRRIFTDLQLPWDMCNAIKYIVRYKDKNGSEDLKKAWDYIARLREDGLDNFTQRRLLKRQQKLYADFSAQFETDVRNVLDYLLECYITKYQDNDAFHANFDALLFDINTLHRTEYGTDAF